MSLPRRRASCPLRLDNRTRAVACGVVPDFDPYRLPRTVVPRRYEVRLEPDLEASTFTGTVAIEVDVTEPTAEVVLNALELDLQAAWVTDSGGRREATVSLRP